MATVVVGITGASGSIYGHRLITHLKSLGHKVMLICTDEGKRVSEFERVTSGFTEADKVFKNDDYFAPVASGSFRYEAMVVLPCSMGTLGKIATGTGSNLLCRAADVRLKEREKLIIVPREMPYSNIHLKNMLTISEAGGVVLPADPHFYTHPQSIEDLVDTVLARVLDQIGLEHQVGKRWGS